jgi:NADH-dependent peroxiredoxin subunit F
MLDTSIKDQLKTHFAKLNSEITLQVSSKEHPKQQELQSMLQDVAECSPKILVQETDTLEALSFSLYKNGTHTGISYRGIPGGHEFTSLILAILNTDHQGKLPDQGIQKRIGALQGPLALKTYISLSCTNCPDVVQALQVISLFNESISHTMIDGAIAEDEIKELGIQGVPAVFTDQNELIHVGKGSLGELLETLESKIGTQSQATEPSSSSEADEKETVPFYDVIVVGGGPAGASAAIYSARKGLSTAVVTEKIGGQVQETKGIENLISNIYTEGPALAADLEKHMRKYDVQILEHRKVEQVIAQQGTRRTLHLKGGETLETEALIIATGAKWRELGIPGEKEYMGRGVAFCPHCDGPFYKGKPVAVIGGGNSGIEAAIDLAGICSHVTVLEFAEELKADEVLVKNAKALPNVTIITNARTSEIKGDDSGVHSLQYQDRSSEEFKEVKLQGVFVQIGLAPNSALIKDLVQTNRFGEIIIDEKCHTNVPGIYAAGDVTTVPYKQIVISMGEGAKAALSAFEDKIHR